jgi:Xaa-Pro aminopeptidase
MTMYPHQTERLDGVLEAFGVDALVATSPADVAYLTGFWSLSRAVFDAEVFAVYAKAGTALVIPTIDAPAFAAGDAAADHVACHGRFHVNLAERADEHARRAARLATAPTDSAADGLARVLDALGLGKARVGLDDTGLLRPAADAIAARFAARRVTPAVGAVARARAVKSPYEIDCLAQALRIAEESIHAVLGELKPGTTEREAVALYEHAVTAQRATPYATTITFGENAALPAAYPSERALRTGELVRFDLGCIFKGYRGDVARMAVVGEPGEREQRAYDAVEAGVQAALDAIRPGVEGGAVFEAAVTAVRAAGLPEFRRHQVGHGIGLAPAEAPWLRPGGDTLEAGMVLRVETPYYELGGFGVSVKETVLVTRGGATVVNRSHRGLVIL